MGKGHAALAKQHQGKWFCAVYDAAAWPSYRKKWLRQPIVSAAYPVVFAESNILGEDLPKQHLSKEVPTMTDKTQTAPLKNVNPHWKCGNCGNTIQAPEAPEQCPSCKEKCGFMDVSCYTPDCGGPGNIDPRLVRKMPGESS